MEIQEAMKDIYDFMTKSEKELLKMRRFLSEYVILIEKSRWDSLKTNKDFKNGIRGYYGTLGGYIVKRGQDFGLIYSPRDYEKKSFL